jgi:hypothetical protein
MIDKLNDKQKRNGKGSVGKPQDGNLFDADLADLDPELDQWLTEYWDEQAEQNKYADEKAPLDE